MACYEPWKRWSTSPVPGHTGQGWTRLLASVLLQEEFSWLRRHMEQSASAGCWGGLIIFLLNNLKFPTVVQQIKSIGVSLWVGTEHWHVLVSASRLSERGLAQILPVLCWHVITMGRAAITVIRWHDTKPSQHTSMSANLSKCLIVLVDLSFDYMTPKDSWFNNLSCHFSLHPNQDIIHHTTRH